MYKSITTIIVFIGLLGFAMRASGHGVQLKPYSFKADNGTTVAAQWGTFDVPLRHGVKNGKSIALSFVRFKSTSPHPGDPIVYLAGGPGGSGIAAARGKRFPLFMALRKVADVIVLDQRGTGASNSIPACAATAPPPPNLTQTRMTAYVDATIRHCMAFWHGKGVDISAYNTLENALDLESLRKALGVAKLNLLGISYGSTLALAALKIMPGNVNRMVLASPLGMNQTLRLPARTQDFLHRVDALLKSDPQLERVYPDLLGTMKTVLNRLGRKPVRVALKAPDGKPVTLAITRFLVQTATIRMLKDPDMLRNLPIMYYAMAAGAYRTVAMPLSAVFSRPLVIGGMGLGVRAAACVSPARQRRVEQQAKSTLLGDALNFTTEAFRSSGIERLQGNICQPVHSAVPAMVLTGTLDGRTYPAGHAEILRGLSNGTEVVVRNAGHDLFMSSPKVAADVAAFFRGASIPYSRIHVPPPDFVLPPAARPPSRG